MLPLSLVATIFTKLWNINRRTFFNIFLTWSATENQENIKTVLQELPVVDILIEKGWDPELQFPSQQFTLLGIEFHVHSLLFYARCVSIFRNESVLENLEILCTLSAEYPLARFAKNMFKIFYHTTDNEIAIEDMIEMIMTSNINIDIEGMIKTLRRIQYCNRTWEENYVFSYDRVPLLCDGLVRDDVKHFKSSWGYPKSDLRCIDCERCKVAFVLFSFCNEYYEDVYRW